MDHYNSSLSCEMLVCSKFILDPYCWAIAHHIGGVGYLFILEVRHPHCVGSITKNFCVLHVQSSTTIFYLFVQ